MGAQPQNAVTPEEILEALARDMPPDLRLAARMPGDHYRQFTETEIIWTDMHEKGLIDRATYNHIMGDRMSFKFSMPARAAPDYIKVIGEAKNSAPMLAMTSQSIGAKRKGDQVVAIRREEVPGMDPREIQDLLMEKLVREELSFQGGLEIAELLAAKKVQSGSLDDEESREMVEAGRKFKKMLTKLMERENLLEGSR